MIRIASVIGLPAENGAECERLHADVWPGVIERLAASHIANYPIYSHGELLFSYMEYVGEDLETDLAAIAADPVTREWRAVCGPLQRPVADRPDGEWWKPLRELFHLD